MGNFINNIKQTEKNKIKTTKNNQIKTTENNKIKTNKFNIDSSLWRPPTPPKKLTNEKSLNSIK